MSGASCSNQSMLLSLEQCTRFDADTSRKPKHAWQVASALLHERDLYLAWSLKRSKAVNGCKTVVGVMGRGHLAGVVYHLFQESSLLRFRDLVGTRRRPPTAPQGGRKMLPGWLTVIAGNVAVAAALQAAWQAISRQSAQP